MYTDLGNGIIDLGSCLIEKDALDIIARIHEYDERLQVLYLDPDKSEICDAPYMIVELCKDGLYRRVMEVWKLDGSVLERLYEADTSKHNVFQRMENHNQRVRDENERRFRDMRDEAKDIFTHLLRSLKTSYTVPIDVEGEHHTVTIDEKHGVTKRDGKSL